MTDTKNKEMFKYKLGDTVYWVKQDVTAKIITCPACNGKRKKKKINGYIFICCGCNNSGPLFKYRCHYTTTTAKIIV
jgi:hypothetical protein